MDAGEKFRTRALRRAHRASSLGPSLVNAVKNGSPGEALLLAEELQAILKHAIYHINEWGKRRHG